MAINHAMNWLWADYQHEVLFVESVGEKPGWTMQSQDMIIWKGMEVLCYSRRYCAKSPVTGAVYVVEDWDDQKITVALHPDYVGKKLFENPPAEPVDEGGAEESDDEALENLGEVAVDRAARERKVDDRVLYDLTHKRFSELMRPQFALVYASIQGRTLRNKICLMDIKSSKMTVRDLITAMSRPTKQSDLNVLPWMQQSDFMRNIYERIAEKKLDLQKMAVKVMGAAPSERRTPSRVGR